MATNHQNGLSTGNGGNTTVQPAATSVINLSNSSDVVIGPMTQYQGSVTIYQYMDATVEASRIAIPNLGNGHMVIDRHNWGAQQGVHGPYKLPHPIPYVLITHIGVHSEICSDVHVCSIKMRTLQDAAIAEKSLQDIPSNFYVGGDGNVYVGRGWDTANAYANMSLAVCFMGDYGRYEPNDLQLSALDHLLTFGEKHRLLTEDYKIVAHRQARTTRSPGIKLYEKITKLTRWYPCGLPGYAKCGVEIGLPTVWDQEYPKSIPTIVPNASANSTQTN
ncbi:AGAP005205-PA [Anopheles gambiae str. PEST]|uniref:AGAP005205-PA n=1 Tax=Anopheles gambiae TaxID=7165 RepID=A7UTA4_ANOGA|nr:AGAP005205-PA [Anopheles gambiae str. PEST]